MVQKRNYRSVTFLLQDTIVNVISMAMKVKKNSWYNKKPTVMSVFLSAYCF